MALMAATRRVVSLIRPTTVFARAASAAAGPGPRDVIDARDAQLRQEHYALPEEVPAHSFDGDVPINREDLFRKRLIYRAKQRGWCVAFRVSLFAPLSTLTRNRFIAQVGS